MMEKFTLFLKVVDTPGGHILICFMMSLIGAGLSIYGHQDVGKEFLVFLAIMAYAMRGRETPPASTAPKDGESK